MKWPLFVHLVSLLYRTYCHLCHFNLVGVGIRRGRTYNWLLAIWSCFYVRYRGVAGSNGVLGCLQRLTEGLFLVAMGYHWLECASLLGFLLFLPVADCSWPSSHLECLHHGRIGFLYWVESRWQRPSCWHNARSIRILHSDGGWLRERGYSILCFLYSL